MIEATTTLTRAGFDERAFNAEVSSLSSLLHWPLSSTRSKKAQQGLR